MLIRGLYYDGWHMRDAPPSERTKKAFIAHIETAFENDPNADTEAVVNEVFELLARKISAGEIADVKHMLPADVRALWPSAGD